MTVICSLQAEFVARFLSHLETFQVVAPGAAPETALLWLDADPARMEMAQPFLARLALPNAGAVPELIRQGSTEWAGLNRSWHDVVSALNWQEMALSMPEPIPKLAGLRMAAATLIRSGLAAHGVALLEDFFTVARALPAPEQRVRWLLQGIQLCCEAQNVPATLSLELDAALLAAGQLTPVSKRYAAYHQIAHACLAAGQNHEAFIIYNLLIKFCTEQRRTELATGSWDILSEMGDLLTAILSQGPEDDDDSEDQQTMVDGLAALVNLNSNSASIRIIYLISLGKQLAQAGHFRWAQVLFVRAIDAIDAVEPKECHQDLNGILTGLQATPFDVAPRLLVARLQRKARRIPAGERRSQFLLALRQWGDKMREPQ